MDDRMTVAVYGAAGHTGRFVVAELARRGLRALRVGRDAARLAEDGGDAAPARVAAIDDAAALDAALRGADALINCAGPYLDTALPLADAALRAGISYLDLTAEQPSVLALTEHVDARARAANLTVVPAAAFYGGLADLLVTAVADRDRPIDRVDIATGLDRWHPTRGTRVTGERNRAVRLVQQGGKPTPVPSAARERVWPFPPPIGTVDVTLLPFSEVMTLARHLRIDTIDSWLATRALRDVRDAATPPPAPADALGRSAQQFAMDAIVAQGGTTHRATASGRDIYAVSAPIIVEAAVRLVTGKTRVSGGVRSLGELFDARDFLAALDTVAVSFGTTTDPVFTRRRKHGQQ
ncbi:saccharopine dehydrogenase NADP-binding domain-containing protein [Burkholderia seminalis]|uniref:saccharopine dehydrogenase NADP-binding domain-containing protein n=1 Tax=Burkholderia seminalis TaxID=488731 RepID=UPI001CF2EB80|nr:saccharopine dehydrogenase NADP-binding domain-containing protein [Burkholderia seminalis]MCA8300435.1 saccharopine dehydrogenase NADP-binding domain-containing protein [Burkholderia seminalis]